ncbi:hypothetical protein C8J57DRAFT_1060837 [Mycena rebaudengoi]|nr:hypothetical protein C8J57DRAFT_1060837 [Mycena rebaudengoi]
MPSSGFDAAPTIGALQIGVLFAVCLFGAVTVQVLLYYTRFTSDSWALKGMVSLVWVLDFSHTIAICNAIYTITVIQYGHPELLVFVPNSLNAAILLSGCIGPLEQGWFAFRLYKFTKTCYLPIFCVALSTCRTIGSLGLATVALGHITVFEFMEEWGWLVATLLMVGVGYRLDPRCRSLLLFNGLARGRIQKVCLPARRPTRADIRTQDAATGGSLDATKYR